MRKTLFASALGLLTIAPGIMAAQATPVRRPPQMTEQALTTLARGVHTRVMTFDTHVDISPGSVPPSAYLQRPGGQVDLARMESGGLDGVFFSIYVGQSTDSLAFTPAGYKRVYDQAIEKILWTHALTEVVAPNRIGLAFTPADAARIYASGRKVAFMGVENAYSLGEDINNIRKFAEFGVRYMSLSHNGNRSQFSDSNTCEADGPAGARNCRFGGLSPLGKQAIAEMNRWGIMIDFSHPSKESMMQTIELSKAPIMGSHSGARAICNHSRNADDEQLQALKKNGGVIQLVGFAGYVKCGPEVTQQRTAMQAEVATLNTEYGITGGGRGGRGAGGGGGGGRGGGGGARGGAAGGAAGAAADVPPVRVFTVDSLTPARRTEYNTKLAAINAKYPKAGTANVKDFIDHVDHVAKLIGIDHIGISSDFDGGGGVEGWNNAGETFNVTLEMVRRGYTEAEIAKIWSGNLMRVLGEVQRVAKEIQATPPG